MLFELLITSSALYAGIRAYKNKKKNQNADKINKQAQSLWSGKQRSQMMKEMYKGTDKLDISQAEKKANQNLIISFASLAITTGGFIYPPLNFIGAALIIYVARHVFKAAYKSLVEERRLTVWVMDSVILPIFLFSGYYFLAALVGVLYALTDKLITKIEDNTNKNLVDVFGQQARFVWILKDNIEIEIPFDALKNGDIVVVNAGESIPVDGTIIQGTASIDQHILTGESQPAEKGIGDQVLAVTVVIEGHIHVQAEKAGEQTVAAQIGQILTNTTDFREFVRLQGLEDANKMVPLRLLLTGLALPLGTSSTLASLNATFGWHMVIIGPLGTLNFLNLASRYGILIKDGRSLQLLSKVDTVVFDKTGTLTQEQPHVGKLYVCNGYEEDQLLVYAAAAEYKQTHPIALAILEKAEQRGLLWPEIEEAKYEVGYGIKVSLGQELIRVGSVRFMEMEEIAIPPDILKKQQLGYEQGYSFVYVAINNQLGGAIELRATIRPEAKRIINYLQQRHLSMYIISGDHEKPTQKLAEELGIKHYFAETLPQNKARLIEKLQAEGKSVCFVGDGINDAIALKKANVSISLRGASSVATDTAQIILMDQSLKQLEQIFEIASEFEANMKINFLITVIPQTIIIGGVFFLHFGLLSSIVLNQIGLLTGLGNAMLPLYTQKSKGEQSGQASIPHQPKKPSE